MLNEHTFPRCLVRTREVEIEAVVASKLTDIGIIEVLRVLFDVLGNALVAVYNELYLCELELFMEFRVLSE